MNTIETYSISHDKYNQDVVTSLTLYSYCITITNIHKLTGLIRSLLLYKNIILLTK